MINDTIEKMAEKQNTLLKKLEIGKYDLVIVLGNNLYKETAFALKNLYDKALIDKKTLVILSGNKGLVNADITSTEAEIINEEINKLNLKLNIGLEKKATNTKENLFYVKEYLKSFENYQSILIICKSYLARRALMCADALDYPLKKMDIYGISGESNKDNWYEIPKARKRILEELQRISEYTLKGDLKM